MPSERDEESENPYEASHENIDQSVTPWAWWRRYDRPIAPFPWANLAMLIAILLYVVLQSVMHWFRL